MYLIFTFYLKFLTYIFVYNFTKSNVLTDTKTDVNFYFLTKTNRIEFNIIYKQIHIVTWFENHNLLYPAATLHLHQTG